MKKITKLSPGTIFNYAKEKFVVLEQMEDGVLCLLAQSKDSVPFHRDGGDFPNNYGMSTLKKDIEGPWLDNLIANGAKRSDLVPFDVDLRQADGSFGYGMLKGVYAAPLTLWQYGKYKDIIPLNEDDWWWLVTPLYVKTPGSPYCSSSYGSTLALGVYNDGYWIDDYCSYSYGIRPALKLNSCLSVSLDGDDEEEKDGECDNYHVDLARVDTLTLIREVERRLSEPVTCEAPDECGCEVEQQ